MDFVSPEPVLQALRERIAHGILGYGIEKPPELREVVVDRLARLYHWHIGPESVLFVPGVVTGFNLVSAVLSPPGSGLLAQTPVYPPILRVANHHGLQQQIHQLTRGSDGYYTVDMASFEAAITPETSLFLLCNPHNPVGRVFTPAELSAMAEVCLRHDVLICSDEIHCDLLFPGQRHVPIATLDPEIARRTVTLIAPSKTYNIAGLSCSVVIAENPELRRRIDAPREDLVGIPNIFGMLAAQAAYSQGDPWLAELLEYLTANRDYVVRYVAERLPGIHCGTPEATYLAWLDCHAAGIPGNPYKFFLKEARVALSDGRHFGPGGEGFVRLNFGCPRSTLEAALDRMGAAMERLAVGEAAAA